MSKNGYSYAPDEFDQSAPQGAPVGVHRAQHSGWRKTWPFLLVAVMFAVVALGGFWWLNNRPEPPATAETSSEAPADPETTDPNEGETLPEEDPDPEPPIEEPAPEPAVAPVFDASVRVLNGAKIDGLAKEAASVLTGAGYAIVEADTYSGTALPANTVYYKTEDMRDTAVDIANHFGIPVDDDHVVLVPQNQAQVSVILMEKFAG